MSVGEKMPSLTPELEAATIRLIQLRMARHYDELESEIRSLVAEADDPLAALRAAIEACR